MPILLDHLAKGELSLWHGAEFVIRLSSIY